MRILSDDTIAALNIWIEARGEEMNGKIAVGEVMLNRLHAGHWGSTVAQVVLAPYQFSGWNTTDHNRIAAAILDDQDPQYVQCVQAWEAAKNGSNIVGVALRYLNPQAVHPLPAWANPANLITTVGHHQFYR